MQALFRDLRFAVRMLIRSPGYAFVAIFTLALAIGANTAIFSSINATLLRPLPFADPDRLLVVYETQPPFDRVPVAYLNYVDYRRQNTSFSEMGAFSARQMNLTGQGDPERLAVNLYAHSVLPTLGREPLLGRNFLPEEDAPRGARAVLLTHGFWTRRFAADPEILGREITLDGAEWTVVGVMPPEFRFYQRSDIIAPLGAFVGDKDNTRSRASLPGIFIVGRMQPGLTIEQARADMQAIGDAIAPLLPESHYGQTRPRLDGLRDSYAAEYRPGLLLLLGAVVLVLLIAATNVANLMLARAMTRQKEMRIRAALGAGRWRLIRQLLVESVLLAVIGGVLGLLIALWGVDLLAAARPQAIELFGPIELDARVLAYTTAVALGTGLLFGLVPAIYASRDDLAQALKDADHHATAGGGQLRIRNLLVVFEVALALMLLVGAALATRGLIRMQAVDPGFGSADLLAVDIALPATRYQDSRAMQQFWTELQRRAAAIPGVDAAVVAAGLPFARLMHAPFYEPGQVRSEASTRFAATFVVGDGYHEALQVPLLAGRRFGPGDTADAPPVLIIDETLAERFFPGEDPVGKRLEEHGSGEPSSEIIGVVGHIKAYHHEGEPLPPYQMYYHYAQLPEEHQRVFAANMYLILRTRLAADNVAAQVRAAVAAVDPEQPISAVTTVEEFIAQSLQERRFISALLAAFAGLALVLAAVGLYAVMAHSVTQRTHELGVRMALGAQPERVVRLVLRQGMLLVGVGVALGVAGALGLTHLMAALLSDQISPTDPATFIGVALLLIVVGLVATYIPARRATRIDPMVALRHE